MRTSCVGELGWELHIPTEVRGCRSGLSEGQRNREREKAKGRSQGRNRDNSNECVGPSVVWWSSSGNGKPAVPVAV